MQGIYDAVGDKIREIFQPGGRRAFASSIRRPSWSIYPVPVREREADHRSRRVLLAGADSRRMSCVRGETAGHQRGHGRGEPAIRQLTCPGTQLEKSAVFVPLVAGDQARGLITLIDMEREHAVQRVRRAPAADAGQQHERRAGKRASLRRDAAAARANRPRWRKSAATFRRRSTSRRCMDRIAQHAKDLLQRGQQRDLPPERRRRGLPRDRGGRRHRRGARDDRDRSVPAKASSAAWSRADARSSSTTPRPIRAACRSTARDTAENERLMVAPLLAGSKRQGRHGRVADGREPFSDERPRLPGRACRCRPRSPSRTRACSRSRSKRCERNSPRVNTVSQQFGGKLDIAPARPRRRADSHVFNGRHRLRGAVRPGYRIIDFPYQYGDELQPLKFGEGLTSRDHPVGQGAVINQRADRSRPRARAGGPRQAGAVVPGRADAAWAA